MKFGEKITNYFHMTGIRNEFALCAHEIGDAIKHVQNVSNHVKNNYDGGANMMIVETISKLCEHMDLLKSCHTSMAKFVEYTGKEMRTWDENSAR